MTPSLNAFLLFNQQTPTPQDHCEPPQAWYPEMHHQQLVTGFCRVVRTGTHTEGLNASSRSESESQALVCRVPHIRAQWHPPSASEGDSRTKTAEKHTASTQSLPINSHLRNKKAHRCELTWA